MSAQLSIYIPFFKGLGFLKEAVESVRAQSNPEWTLVVMDDCGPDGTAAQAWIESLSDHRITYLRHAENKGMVANWNACLEHATRRHTPSHAQPQPALVTLLHDDDRLLPHYVELMLAEHGSNPHAALYFCGAEVIDTQGRRIFSFPDYVKKFIAPPQSSYTLQGEGAFEALLAGCFIMCPTISYNLNVLGTRRFTYGLKQVQDLDFYLRLLDENLTLQGTATKAYAYRRHPTNATALQTQSLLRFEEEAALYDSWAKRLSARGFVGAAAVARKKRIILLNLLYCIVRDVLGFSFTSARTKIKFLTRRVLNTRAALPMGSTHS